MKKHLLFVAALIVAMQPLLAGLNRPNGATLLAAILVIVWGFMAVNSQGSRRTVKTAPSKPTEEVRTM